MECEAAKALHASLEEERLAVLDFLYAAIDSVCAVPGGSVKMKHVSDEIDPAPEIAENTGGLVVALRQWIQLCPGL